MDGLELNKKMLQWLHNNDQYLFNVSDEEYEDHKEMVECVKKLLTNAEHSIQ